MGLLEFISSILVGWAWPALAVIAFFALRNKLSWLAEQFEEIGLPGGGHIKFRKRLEAAQEAADEVAVEEGVGRPDSAIRPDDPFLELAERFPEAAVLDAFKNVERALDAYRPMTGTMTKIPSAQIMRKLQKEGHIGPALVELFDRVRSTRNEVVHSIRPKISPAEAIVYREWCEQLIHGLEVGLRKRQEEQLIIRTATEKVAQEVGL